MKKISIIILILLDTICYSQSGKYFGKEYSCAVSHSLNQYYWIDLKDNKTFEYNSFYLDEDIDCKHLKGNWSASNDTIYLKTKKKTYYYLFSKNTITSPDVNSDRRAFYGKYINSGIDDFGLGITEMIKIEESISEDSLKSWIETVKYWSNKSCR